MEKRGFCNYKLKNNEKAILDFSKAIDIADDEIQLYFFRGNTYLQKSDFLGALSDFNFLLSKNPNHSSGYNQRGLAKLVAWDTLGACQDFKKSYELGNITSKVNIDRYCK